MGKETQEHGVFESISERPKDQGPRDAVGHLAGEVCLAVHTHQALRLIWGRRRTAKKSAITGLIAFASAVNTIWQAAEQGDPYAFWWLIKIETGIEQCRDSLKEQLEETGFLYPDADILEVATAESEQPHRTRLAFSNPYAYRSAYMLGEYDVLVRSCHTLKFVGAAEPDELMATIARAGHSVRRVFAIPQGFKVCAITSEDLRQGNQRAQRAVRSMGPLPEKILTGEMRPLFLPPSGQPHAGTVSPENTPRVTRNAPALINELLGDANGEAHP